MDCPNCQAPNDDSALTCFTCGHALVNLAAIRKGAILGGRYEILSPLGKGGMGAVFKAHDTVLDEIVALKVLRSDVATGPDMARRFRQEIKLARKVRHKNVCGIHEYGEEGGHRYIAMELIEGQDLHHFIEKQGVPPLDEAFEISIQICEGLQAIHDAGIIHRDLKALNIMRDAKGCVRLMDFGIAKSAAAGGTLGATALGMIVGTPEYMSPEQARGEKVDFRADIYAMGILVFEIFSGHVPLRGETPIATLMKQIQEMPRLEDPEDRIPMSLVPVLAKALAKNRDHRYASSAEMTTALRAAWEKAVVRAPKARVAPSRTAEAPELEPVAHRATPVPTPVPTEVHTAVQTGIERAAPVEPQTTPHHPSPEELARAARQSAGQQVDALLSTGKLEDAAAVLSAARSAHGDGEPLTGLEARLAEAQRQAREHAVQGWMAEGERRLGNGRYEEALEAFRYVLEHDPNHRPAQTALARAEESLARAREEQERASALAQAVASIQGLLERGDLGPASAELTSADTSFPKAQPLRALRTRLRELENAQKKRQQERERLEQERLERERIERERLTRQQQEREILERERQSRQALASAPPRPAARPGKVVGVAAAFVGVAAVAAVGLWVTLGRRTPEAAPSTTPASTAPAVSSGAESRATPSSGPGPVAPGPTGVLVIDAQPWGEVAEIRDSSGARHSLGASRYTPVALELPPGEYTITLKNPDFPRSLAVSAKVQSSRVESCRGEFRKMTAADYFKRVGF